MHSGFHAILREEKLCDKPVVVEETGECMLVYCRRSDVDILIAYTGIENWVYSKMTPEPLVKPYMWHCSEVFLNPYGLYTFAHDDTSLVRRMAQKVSLLIAQYRLAASRLQESPL